MAKQSGPDPGTPSNLPENNLEVGMNFDQWRKDRAGFRTSIAMVTGGESAMFGEYSGPEVGDNYQGGLGEDRHEVTYLSYNDGDGTGVPAPPGRMGKAGPVSPGEFQKKSSTGFGKSTLRSPQTYRIFSKGD